eukprot:scaffold13281_cov119-Isochrysis_galbana.AAC.11
MGCSWAGNLGVRVDCGGHMKDVPYPDIGGGSRAHITQSSRYVTIVDRHRIPYSASFTEAPKPTSKRQIKRQKRMLEPETRFAVERNSRAATPQGGQGPMKRRRVACVPRVHLRARRVSAALLPVGRHVHHSLELRFRSGVLRLGVARHALAALALVLLATHLHGRVALRLRHALQQQKNL